MKSRLHETAYLNPGLTILYDDLRREEPEHIVFHEEDGIIGFVREMNKKGGGSARPDLFFRGERGDHGGSRFPVYQ